MLNTIRRLTVALILLGTAFGCAAEQPQVAIEASPSESSQPTAATSLTASSRPAQKTETVSVEGETEEMLLELYDESAVPFTTYFPAEFMVADGGCSDEGCGYRFSAKAGTDAAYVHFFFPSGSPTVAEMKESYLENLLASNNWQRLETPAQSLPYPWVREFVRFFDPQKKSPGQVIIGEAQGQVFAIIEFMEAEFVEGFAPRVVAIYENLEFRDSASQP